MNRFCSVTECHVCCYLTNILNSPATVGSAAKGHTSLGDRAPFPLLLAWEVGCFGDGTHDNFGDALWSLLWGRFTAAADSSGNSPLWCAQLLWHFFKLMSWRDQRQNSSGKSEFSVQILNVARPNFFFFAICLIFADKLPLLMGLTSRAEQAVFSSSCRGQHCVTKSLRGNPTGNLKHSHIDANASHVKLPTDYILKQMCWHFTEKNE